MNIFSLDFALKQFPAVLSAVPVTLLIAVVSMFLGMILGLLIALCRIYKVPVLSKIAAVYVSFIRGTPILVQLYVFFTGLRSPLAFLTGSLPEYFPMRSPLWLVPYWPIPSMLPPIIPNISARP